MSLTELKSKTGRVKRKRVGRGNGSGHGTFSCKGMNGQTARAGGRRRPGFEGGQTPYLRRMPKLKGFKNPNYVEYQAINVGTLEELGVKEITPEVLYEKNLISKKDRPVKLLAGKGELKKALNITVHKASKAAADAVAASKGKLTLLSPAKEEPTKEKKKEEKAEAPAETK